MPVSVNITDWGVRSISSKRNRHGRIEYRVDWASTWYNAEVLDSCKKHLVEIEDILTISHLLLQIEFADCGDASISGSMAMCSAS